MSKRPPSSSSGVPLTTTARGDEATSLLNGDSNDFDHIRSPDSNEKLKKARSGSEARSNAGDSCDHRDGSDGRPDASDRIPSSSSSIHVQKKSQCSSERTIFPTVMDMETALATLFPDTPSADDGGFDNSDGREMLTLAEEDEEATENKNTDKKSGENAQTIRNKRHQQQPCWVRFRPGHTGDASSLASLCRQAQKEGRDCGSLFQSNNKSASNTAAAAAAATTTTTDGSSSANNHGEEEDTAEMRLASGFGDEDTPPAFHAILAEVFWHGSNISSDGNKDKNSGDGAVAKSNCNLESECGGSTTVLKSDEKNHVVEKKENGKGKSETIAPEGDIKEDRSTTIVDKTKVSQKNQHQQDIQKMLGAAALVTIEWDVLNDGGGARILRVVFLHVAKANTVKNTRKIDENRVKTPTTPCHYDRDLLKRRLLLRLSALGLATGCDALRLPPD